MKFYGSSRKEKAINYISYLWKRAIFNLEYYSLNIALMISLAALFAFLICMNVYFLR